VDCIARVAWLALLVIQGLLPAATVYLTRALVNSLVAVVSSGGSWATLQPARLLGILMGLIMLAGQLLGVVTGWVRTIQGELVTDHITELVHRQCVRPDLAFYDSAQYFDRRHRARAEASYRPLSLLESLGGLLQNSITLVAMAALLLPYGAWLPVGLLARTLPALCIVLHIRAREHGYSLRVAPTNGAPGTMTGSPRPARRRPRCGSSGWGNVPGSATLPRCHWPTDTAGCSA